MDNLTAEKKKQELEMKKMSECAVAMATQVNKYITKHCLNQMRDDPSDSIFLEAMTVSYVVAMRSFSLYQALPTEQRPTWEDMESDAIEMMKTTFKQVKFYIDLEVKPCQYN